MFRRIGAVGVVGVLMITAGLGVVTWQNPFVGAGLAFVLAGVGLVVRSMVQSLVSTFMAPANFGMGSELEAESEFDSE